MVLCVCSADPRRVPEAFVLDELRYEEAAELAHFGAKARIARAHAARMHCSAEHWANERASAEPSTETLHSIVLGRAKQSLHLRRDWAHPCHVCAGTGPTPCHICAGTDLQTS